MLVCSVGCVWWCFVCSLLFAAVFVLVLFCLVHACALFSFCVCVCVCVSACLLALLVKLLAGVLPGWYQGCWWVAVYWCWFALLVVCGGACLFFDVCCCVPVLVLFCLAPVCLCLSVCLSLDNECWKEIDWDFGFVGDGFMVIPEGGKGELAFLGFEELVEWWKGLGIKPWVFHASATGTTAVGLVRAFEKMGLEYRLSSVLVLKNIEEQRIYFDRFVNWGLKNGSHEFLLDSIFGGYAKTTDELFSFTQNVLELNPDQLFDPIYTAKALYSMDKRLLLDPSSSNQGYSPVFLHTGGQLGGFSEKFSLKSL